MITSLLSMAIGIGLAASLFFSEFFGLAAGGMVVPGYVALHLNKPVDVLLTLAAAILTATLVRGISNVAIVYGRRRTVLSILIGYLVGYLFRYLVAQSAGLFPADLYSIIGYIIPGLIAIWIDRQGLVETVTTLLTASVVVRLLLIVIVGNEVAL